MKILSSPQTRELDEATIINEPISSTLLMERASTLFTEKFLESYPNTQNVVVICGPGNNGGDGLAIARLLHQKGKSIKCLLTSTDGKYSADNTQNQIALAALSPFQHLNGGSGFASLEAIDTETIIIDAIMGTGLNRPLSGFYGALIQKINELPNDKVSVDIPSGLFSDKQNGKSDPIIKAKLCITFHCPKITFFFPENQHYIENFNTIDIGLHQITYDQIPSSYFYTTTADIRKRYKPRGKFSHKGSFGHALIVAGSYGMMGAALLANKACVRSGAGKSTAHIPGCGLETLQQYSPETMVWADFNKDFIATTYETITDFDAVGLGPGLGKHPKTVNALEFFLRHFDKPMVLDADALNILSENKQLLELIPNNSIITPHLKEFDRLFGHHETFEDKLATGRKLSKERKLIIILKNAYTAVILPNGNIHFNSTGNPGLSKGGSGDVLLGIITALLAQNYNPESAAILGVFIHGLAADIIVKNKLQTVETLSPSDLIEHLHLAYSEITEK